MIIIKFPNSHFLSGLHDSPNFSLTLAHVFGDGPRNKVSVWLSK